ncbi:EAL domain-containing protein [Vibrio cyclitrophicus]|uniref:EAL domain-containing protein n=1 Tax=Vibrio cyclitrophicus TaxID=47951 RepID=UPI00148BF51A|nr:EAL domain-containing protein [Vibrio cyclitrophicus]NOI33206.1 EAL domain-containing protein [Vibrio cyclitrophicus]
MTVSKENIEIALINNEFEPYFQPIMSLDSGKVVRCEVLARWICHSGVIAPHAFLNEVLSFGLLDKMTNQIIKKALSYCLLWTQSNILSDMGVSINFHYEQLVNINNVEYLIQLLRSYGLATSMVEIEITEAQVIENHVKLTSSLDRLRQEGISIALDDFGVGSSSLSTLKTLPINTLKVDRSFVKDIDSCNVSRTILKGIFCIANAIGINIVVEGVETKEQLNFIRKTCDNVEIQGYLCSPPLPFEKFYHFAEMTNLNSLHSFSLLFE